MNQITRTYIHLLALRQERSDRGASLIEYALLVALIAVVCIVALTLMGDSSMTE